jgi:exopolysaccharide production protein ExoZ
MYEKNTIHSIHFLRFIAAFAVVVFHVTGVNSKINFGASGVDIFFVISGVVIGLTITSGDSAKNFALKRFIRVMPLYWLATIAMILDEYYSWRVWPKTDDVIRSIFLFPNFGTDWHFIYFPGWTLAYEILFYFGAATSLLIFRNKARAVCLLAFSALAVCRIHVPGSPDSAVVETNMFMEFCAGLVISSAVIKGFVVDRGIGAACIFIACILIWLNQHPSLPRSIAWGIPCVMLVLGVMGFERMAWLRSNFAKIGGDSSYAIYLTHVLTILAIETFSFKHAIPLARHVFATWVVDIVACIVVGVVVHKWIERPMLNFLRGRLLPKRAASSASGVAVSS